MKHKWIEVGNLHANQGQLKEAVKAFQKALEEEPENLDVRGYIIGLSLKSGDWPEVVNQHLQCADTFISWGD